MAPEAPTILPDQEVKTDERTETMPPWKVLIVNDEVTTFDFVIWILVTLFHKPAEDAVRLTWEIHRSGVALVTVTSKERAELYVEQVASLARPRGFPLTATMEEA